MNKSYAQQARELSEKYYGKELESMLIKLYDEQQKNTSQFAFGGDIGKDNGDVGLSEFNTGGRHNENKLGGVLQGYNEYGEPNRVEQGETKYQDYIFSDRLKIDKQAAEEHRLPKSMINKTFADASKKIAKLHKERPNDPITRDTMRSKMDHLMMANDEVRDYEQSSMMTNGGRLYANGGLEIGKLNEKVAKISAMNLDPKTKLGYTGNLGEFFGDSKNLRYAPIAFDALAATGLFGKSPQPEQYSPALIQQQGSLSAPQINEEAMRSKIDAAYQNQIRGLAGASGGSGAALRGGLTGLNSDYILAVGQGFLGADTANKQAKMQADQYNLGTATNVASQNAQMQNRAGLYNNQMINQNNALNYDTRMSYLGKGAEGLGDIGYEQRMMEIFPKTTGYTDMGDWAAAINAAKKNPNAKACGGRLRTIKHKNK